MAWTERRSGVDGFTLVELLAAILISGIVLAGIYSVFISQQKAFSIQDRIAEMNQNSRSAMDLMTRQIRLAGYKPATASFSGIVTAQGNTLRILADLNQDGNTTGDGEDVTYSYNADTRQILRNAVPIAENITSLNFVYTLTDGTTTATPASLADIRKVAISVTARTAYPDPNTGQYRTMTSDVTPRNLAD